jgi:hypothetical protein
LKDEERKIHLKALKELERKENLKMPRHSEDNLRSKNPTRKRSIQKMMSKFQKMK